MVPGTQILDHDVGAIGQPSKGAAAAPSLVMSMQALRRPRVIPAKRAVVRIAGWLEDLRLAGCVVGAQGLRDARGTRS